MAIGWLVLVVDEIRNIAHRAIMKVSVEWDDCCRLLGRGSMHVFSCEQFQKLMNASGFSGPWHSLVDLGAGDGATTAHVAHLFEKVYATDISAPMRWALAKRQFT